ncbi:MAG: ABC transporter substrate-binding protein, partial [Promethearchaeota archaeon]
GTIYYIGLTKEDTKELADTLAPDVYQGAVNRLLDVKKAEYIVGGYRTEAVLGYIDLVMDAQKLFLGTGCASDNLSALVAGDHDTYKYWFRSMPHPSSAQGTDIFTFLGYITHPGTGLMMQAFMQGLWNLTYPYERNITRLAMVYEPKQWAIDIAGALDPLTIQYGLNGLFGCHIESVTSTLLDPLADWTTQINNVMATQPQIVIPVLSDYLSNDFLAAIQAYTAGPKPFIAGIDVDCQEADKWTRSGGDVEGVVFTSSDAGLNVSYSNMTVPFCNAYYEQTHGDRPLYTATGAYDAMYLLKYALENTDSFNVTGLIAEMESWTTGNPLINATAASPYFAFTATHDPQAGLGYYQIMWGQWQADQQMWCIPAGQAFGNYPDSLAQKTIELPDELWGTPANPFPP